MPDFPDDIKDLISKMLTVDPLKRISLNEIKEHPAFRRNIPEFYTFPTPLPIPSITTRIDPNSLDEETINCLHQLGFDDDEELNKELLSDENTMAKVFVSILTCRQTLDNLPWAYSEEEDEEQRSNFDENLELMYPGGVPLLAMGSAQLNTSDPFHRTKHILHSMNSPDTYSIIERSILPDDTPTMVCNMTTPIKEIVVPLESLFTAIQKWLPKKGFAWFYPDETKLLARRKSDGLDIIMQSSVDIDNLITLNVSLPKGNQDAFSDFVDELQNLINEIVPE